MFTESKAVNKETVKIRQEFMLDSKTNRIFNNPKYFSFYTNIKLTYSY